MNPLSNAEDDTAPDLEIDPTSGKLREVRLEQNSIVFNPINRKLIYTKTEVDAKIAASGGSVTSVAGKTGAVILVEGDITNLTTDLAAKSSKPFAIAMAVAL